MISYTTKERDLLARIMRAEAISDGDLAMLMVGNIVVNRVITNCFTFKNINTIYDAIYQENQFQGINNSVFLASPTTHERSLADKVLKGKNYYPATNSLWFYGPPNNESCTETWYNHSLAGRYKTHCFYKPQEGECDGIL